LGSTGTNVVARVTGLVLTALDVQVMIVGFQNVLSASK
jgi:small neutral amino acid transporter SnatA (MarC family)